MNVGFDENCRISLNLPSQKLDFGCLESIYLYLFVRQANSSNRAVLIRCSDCKIGQQRWVSQQFFVQKLIDFVQRVIPCRIENTRPSLRLFIVNQANYLMSKLHNNTNVFIHKFKLTFAHFQSSRGPTSSASQLTEQRSPSDVVPP